MLLCHAFLHSIPLHLQVSEVNDADGEPMDLGVASSSSSHKDLPLPGGTVPGGIGLGIQRTASDGATEPKRQRVQAQVADPLWELEKQHVDSIINFLIRSVRREEGKEI